MRITILYISLLVCSLLPAARACAQYSYNDVENITATVQPLVNLNLIKNNSAAINFNSSATYLNGVTIPNYITFKIKSNIPWMLNVSAATTYFTASGSSSSANMPASVLGFTVGTAPAIYRLSTAATRLASGTRGNELSSGNSFNANLLATPNYDYGAGIYTIVVNYTVTAQ